MISYCVLKDFKFKTLKVRKKTINPKQEKNVFSPNNDYNFIHEKYWRHFYKVFEKVFIHNRQCFFLVTLRRKYDIYKPPSRPCRSL